jgi:hypothetical protein
VVDWIEKTSEVCGDLRGLIIARIGGRKVNMHLGHIYSAEGLTFLIALGQEMEEEHFELGKLSFACFCVIIVCGYYQSGQAVNGCPGDGDSH